MPDIPTDAPPSYATATGSSTSSAAAGGSSSTANTNTKSSHLNVPGSSGSRIPLAHRRSMEDEARALPPGWVRQFDPQSQHQFFVDTTKEPPRSIWHHPYDDDEYLASLSSEERERLEQESMQRAQNPTKADIIHAHSDDEDVHHASSSNAGSTIPTELPPRPDGKGKAPEHKSFGRRFKDKVTGTTHEQRVAERKKREEREQQMYEQHVRIREGMAEAAKTGKPVHIGKDTDGRDVYVEPPGYGGLNLQGDSINPYTGGTYTTPNARYIRPAQGYSRPAYDGWDYNTGGYAPGYSAYGPSGFGRPAYGYGRPGYYGGGMGMGTGLALGGGLGLLLGTSLLI